MAVHELGPALGNPLARARQSAAAASSSGWRVKKSFSASVLSPTTSGTLSLGTGVNRWATFVSVVGRTSSYSYKELRDFLVGASSEIACSIRPGGVSNSGSYSLTPTFSGDLCTSIGYALADSMSDLYISVVELDVRVIRGEQLTFNPANASPRTITPIRDPQKAYASIPVGLTANVDSTPCSANIGFFSDVPKLSVYAAQNTYMTAAFPSADTISWLASTSKAYYMNLAEYE